MPNITEALVDRVLQIRDESLTGIYDAATTQALLDYVAVEQAGLADMLAKASDADALRAMLSGSASDRALVLGMAAHRLELDDGYRMGGIHIGASVVSALAALDVGSVNVVNLVGAMTSERTEWRHLVAAVVCGYEAAGVLATLMQPAHKRRGFHASGTCGCIGAAAACAVALGCDADQLKRVLSAAAGMASGLLELQEDGSQLKPLNVGNAASRGVTAALLGGMELRFPEDAIGGPRGLMACTGVESVLANNAELSELGVLKRCYRKRYPSCRHGHSAIDVACELRQDASFTIDAIESVDVSTYRDAIVGHDLIDIETSQQAMMSTPYCVAAMLADGFLGLDSFEFGLQVDGPELPLVRKVHMVEDERLSSLAPTARGARVRIAFKDGRALEREVLYPKGEPENPMTAQELTAKALPLLERAGWARESAEFFAATVLTCNVTLHELSEYATEAERI